MSTSRLALLSLGILSAIGPAYAQTCSRLVSNFQLLPVVKVGQCPVGYYADSGFCVPNEGIRQALAAIKSVNGACPFLFFPSGDYCLSPANYPNFVISRIGNTCPRGWSNQQSLFCVKLCDAIYPDALRKKF